MWAYMYFIILADIFINTVCNLHALIKRSLFINNLRSQEESTSIRNLILFSIYGHEIEIKYSAEKWSLVTLCLLKQ